MEETRRDGGGNSTFGNNRPRTADPVLAPSLRILCLHDSGSNAGELSDQLEVLGERLYENHRIDLVYVNSPLLLHNKDNDDSDEPPSSSNGEPKRVWWEEKVDPNNPDGPKQFVGLDASLLLLRQVWNSMPFWGILAVGQGAAAAAFLPLLPVSPPPCCMIFLHGETLLEEQELLLVDNQLACLHLMSKEPSLASERLLYQFGGQVYTGVSRGFTSKTLNLIGKVRHLTSELYLCTQGSQTDSVLSSSWSPRRRL